MLRSCLGGVRTYASIYAKVRVKPIHVKHDFHKVIKWNQPEHFKPWHPQRSCDLQPLPPVDPTWLKLEYRPFADTINKLPEEQRKLFTVEYGHRKDGIDVIMEDTLELVRQHKYDQNSLEFKIARYTVKIRNYQDQFANYEVVRKSGVHRKQCKEFIEKRKKFLTRLRAQDYKRFEWLLDVLAILYKPKSLNCRIERRPSINVLVNMFCNELRDKKMHEYKMMLESEKIPFLEMKLDTLNQIKVDEESINVPCSVEEEITQTAEILRKFNMKSSEKMTIHPVDSHSQMKQIAF